MESGSYFTTEKKLISFPVSLVISISRVFSVFSPIILTSSLAVWATTVSGSSPSIILLGSLRKDSDFTSAETVSSIFSAAANDVPARHRHKIAINTKSLL